MVVFSPFTEGSDVVFEAIGSCSETDVIYRVLGVAGGSGCRALCSPDAPPYAPQVQVGCI
jgi:hypothetical protein